MTEDTSKSSYFSNNDGTFKVPMPVPNLKQKATDRSQEIAQFLHRMKKRQESQGVCDETSVNENGTHKCPILG